MTKIKKNPDAVRGAVNIAAEFGINKDDASQAFYLCQQLLAEGVIVKVGRLYYGSRERLRERMRGAAAS